MSDLFDWWAEYTDRDPKDYGYKRIDMRLSPYMLGKTFLLQTIPMGNKYFGSCSFERLERVSGND